MVFVHQKNQALMGPLILNFRETRENETLQMINLDKSRFARAMTPSALTKLINIFQNFYIYY